MTVGADMKVKMGVAVVLETYGISVPSRALIAKKKTPPQGTAFLSTRKPDLVGFYFRAS
ncbi:MAG: hypothetical protein ACJAU6_002709 [Alphaproteobacteria bacterium]|jgi:hypothetical protein